VTPPEFVQYGALMTPPAPFRFVGAKLHGFWAKADPEKLSALCERVFAEPSGRAVQYRPMGGEVMLSWGLIDRAFPESEGFDRLGSVEEPQVAVWVPVARVREKEGERYVPDGFAMFVPYIWLDNPMSLATGRELFGYPKSWGWPTIAADEDPPTWKLDVFGLDFDSESRAGRRPLLEITGRERGIDLESALHGLVDVAKHAAEDLFTRREGELVLPDLHFTEELVRDLRGHGFPQVFLKQFRSVEDGLAAALQQIVEVRYEVTRLHAAPMLGTYDLRVKRLDSQPLVDELGLEDQTLHLAYEVDMDFTLGGGRVVWDAAAG
jgi:acetoacetate decarboxylase